MLIPKEVADVARVATGESSRRPINCVLVDGRIAVATDGRKVVAKRVWTESDYRHEYPDWRQVIPESFAFAIMIDPNHLIDLLVAAIKEYDRTTGEPLLDRVCLGFNSDDKPMGVWRKDVGLLGVLMPCDPKPKGPWPGFAEDYAATRRMVVDGNETDVPQPLIG